MQRNRFLGDLFSTIFDRRSSVRGKADTRDLHELCSALLSAEGEVSGLRLASTILARYSALDIDEKLNFFKFLNTDFDIDATDLARLAAEYAMAPSPEGFEILARSAEPKRQELFRRLNQPVGATAELVAMRVDLLGLLKQSPELHRTNHDFVHLLKSWFNRGFLVLQQISWDTPASILDKIVAYEAVHQINDWEDLRRRLYPDDRRCFAFFHPSMPEEPLIFVEVALTETIPVSIDDVLSDSRDVFEADQAKVAVFYSISNCQKGLAGVSFGNLLIKQVVSELSNECPQLDSFVTLSPIPGLNSWLAKQTSDPLLGEVAQLVLDGSAEKEDVRAIAARFILDAKQDQGLPVDPVARFHLGNGAEVHDIHAGADTSPNGLAQSGGAMVNYLYDQRMTEVNHESFATRSDIAASRQVKALATAAFVAKPKEPST